MKSPQGTSGRPRMVQGAGIVMYLWPGCMSRHHQNSCLHPGGEEADANTQAVWAEASWSKSKVQFEENPGLQRNCAIRSALALN